MFANETNQQNVYKFFRNNRLINFMQLIFALSQLKAAPNVDAYASTAQNFAYIK